MTEADGRVHRALAVDSRVALLAALRASPRPLGAGELAEQAALHLTTVRAHLDVLIDAGLATSQSEERSSPGRPRVLYQASPPEQPVQDDNYRLLAEILTGHIAATATDPAGQAKAAGETWGAYLVNGPPPFVQLTSEQARDKVMELFAKLGFEPELADEGHRILLRRCPFLDVARRHPDVVCSMHLGLLQGALGALRAPLAAERLESLIEPSLCVAHLNGGTSA